MSRFPPPESTAALQQSEQVRQYVAGELCAAQVRAFEVALLADSTLQTLVEAELALREPDAWATLGEPAPPARAMAQTWRWQWAAGMLLLLGGVWGGYTLRGPVEPEGALAWVALSETRGYSTDWHRVPADMPFAARLVLADLEPVLLELLDEDGNPVRQWQGVQAAADGYVTVWVPALPAASTHVLRRIDANGARRDYHLHTAPCPC